MPRKRKVQVVNQENVEPVEKIAVITKKNDKPEKSNKKQKIEPDWATGSSASVVKIILSMQKSDCNTNKCTTELNKMYRAMDHKSFMIPFIKITRLFLCRDERHEGANRVLKFIGHFVASFGEEVDAKTGASHPLIQDLFKEILKFSSDQIHIRVRLCSLVTLIMSSFSQKAEIDETIIDKITERMLYFMKDVSPNVRAQAVLGLQRLQDPDNPEDPVTKAYVFHMEADPAAKTRQATITAIAKKLSNMPCIIERLHDADEKVRRHTYLQMASFSVKSYKIADRIAILTTGLNDRSEMVKKSVVNILLANWVGVYDYDYAELIRATKLDSTEKELIKFRKLADQTLNEVFKKRKLSDMIAYLNLEASKEFKNCLPLERSSLEMLLVWKSVVKFHQEYVAGRGKNAIRDVLENSDEEEELNQNATISNVELIPELSIFCEYVNKFVDDFKFGNENDAKLSKMYFSQSLVVIMEIVQLNDLDDEIGREQLQKLLRKILLQFDLSEFAIQAIAQVVEKIIPKVEDRLKYFNSIVNEVVKIGAPSEYSRQTIIQDLINRSDMDRKLKANNIKLKLMDLKEQETIFAERKQYAECQKVQDEYAKLNNELISVLRPVAEAHSLESTQSLSLLECLSSTEVKQLTPAEVLKNLRICYYAIKSKDVKVITHEILSIYNEFIRYHLESNDIYIRIWALQTATAYSIIYESIAQDIFYILKSQIFRNAHVLMWECAIDCIVDLLLRYSIEKMDNFDNKLDGTNVSLGNVPSSSMVNSNQSRSKRGGARTLYTDADGEDDDGFDEGNIVKNLDIMQMLLHVIEQNVDKRIYKVTIVGVGKLILHGVYCTRDIISKFLLLYFNPATDSEIGQILGVFLENIIRRKKQEFLHDALHPTIMTLLEAPHDSPLREVKLETVLRYIVGATRPIFCSNGLNLHNTLGTKFLEIMQENSDSKDVLKAFAKELLELEIGEDPMIKKDMIKSVDLLLKESSADARIKKSLTDFRSILNGTYKARIKFSSTAKVAPVVPEEEDGLENIEEENEEEAANIETPVINQPDENTPPPEEPSANTSLTVSPAKKKLLEVSIRIPKSNTNVTLENETLTEDVQEIPESPQHIEIPATQVVHVEIPATQQLEESKDEASIISTDEEMIPSTPVTPVTVKSKRNRGKQLEHEEYPPTPTSSSQTKSIGNAAKRVLEISRSIPSTPSVASPIRKVPKSVTPNSSTLSSSTPKASTFVTPRSEARMTRNQAREEIAQTSTVTRSASKLLNVKSTRSSIELTTKAAKPEVSEKKAAASKLPVKKTSTSSTRSQTVSKTQSETTLDTRQLRTRVPSQPTAKSSKTSGKASSRPPWK